ncbi:MAG: NTP transferase domain-containing protein [Thaumarchaeota archaeon]|nr:NTP transferase domain-containing protein [Nitrososphaerota archaeon]
MMGIVMAGGRGSRMKVSQEKLLLGQRPVVLDVLDALYHSRCFTSVMAVTSPNSPQTRSVIVAKGYDIMDTPGAGYSEDLSTVLTHLDGMVFVASADMPLLDANIIREIIQLHDSADVWTTILVTEKYLNSLKLSTGTSVMYDGVQCCYTGISVVDSSRINSLDVIPEKFLIINDRRVAFNLNTKEDYSLLGTT